MMKLFSLALLPAVILLRYVYRMDTIEKEPTALLLRLFLFGCLSALPASILEGFGERYVALFDTVFSARLFEAFVVVAVSEEGCKYFFLRRMWNHPAFDYRFDAIVYAVAVSLGFAALENILYVFRYGISTGILRAVTSVPGHCFFGVFMGYWFGRAKYAACYGLPGSRTQRLLAFAVPALLHGFYDFCCFMGDTWYYLALFYVFLCIFFTVSIRYIKKASACDVSLRGQGGSYYE